MTSLYSRTTQEAVLFTILYATVISIRYKKEKSEKDRKRLKMVWKWKKNVKLFRVVAYILCIRCRGGWGFTRLCWFFHYSRNKISFFKDYAFIVLILNVYKILLLQNMNHLLFLIWKFSLYLHRNAFKFRGNFHFISSCDCELCFQHYIVQLHVSKTSNPQSKSNVMQNRAAASVFELSNSPLGSIVHF